VLGYNAARSFLIASRRRCEHERQFVNWKGQTWITPLNAVAIRHIADAIEPLAFDRICGAWWDRNIATDAKSGFAASVRRYLAAIS
jgi:hypothetical protein